MLQTRVTQAARATGPTTRARRPPAWRQPVRGDKRWAGRRSLGARARSACRGCRAAWRRSAPRAASPRSRPEQSRYARGGQVRTGGQVRNGGQVRTEVRTEGRNASPAEHLPLPSKAPAPLLSNSSPSGAAVGHCAVGHPRGGSGAHGWPHVPAQQQARAEARRRARRRAQHRVWRRARRKVRRRGRGDGRRAPRSEPAVRCSPAIMVWRWGGDGVATCGDMWWWRRGLRRRTRVWGQGQGWRRRHASCSRLEIPRRAWISCVSCARACNPGQLAPSSGHISHRRTSTQPQPAGPPAAASPPPQLQPRGGAGCSSA